MNQQETIVKLQQGDEQAFKTLIDEWQDIVYNIALGIVQNEDDADDITQDVFIQVYQSISSFKGNAGFSTWLYKITTSKSLDHLRRMKTKKRFGFIQRFFGEKDSGSLHTTEFDHPGIVMENKEKSKVLFKALQQLPVNQRVAFTLHKLEAQKHQHIAAIMNLSVSATESLIARAKINLRKLLETNYKQNSI